MDVPRIRRPRLRKSLLTLGALAVCLIAVASLAAFSHAGRIAPPVLKRDVAWFGTVERGPLSIDVRAPGRLVPENERWITAPTEGVVERVLVKPGHVVEPGSVLFELSNRRLRRELLEAELSVRAERAAVAAARSRLASEVLDLEASVSRLRADLAESQLKVATNERLDAEGMVSPFELKVDRLRAEEVRRHHDIEKQRLAQRRDSIETVLAAEQARFEMAEAMLAYLQREVASLSVRVEAAGIVTELAPDVGSRVQLGDLLARIIDPQRLRAELDVPQARAREIRVGQTVIVDTRGAEVEGVISRIDPSVRDAVVKVDVDLVGPLPEGARAELRVDGKIQVEHLGDVLHVRRPRDARERASLDLFRLVVGQDEAVRVNVELGRLSVTEAEIVGGLKEGDRVVLSDTSPFTQADRIRIR